MNSYLSNYRFGERLFNSIPKSNTSLIVVIPCHNEPDLISSLNALFSCQIPPSIAVEVIVVINAGFDAEEEIKNQNQSTLELAKTWSQENQKENIDYLFYLNNNLPKKLAGVGLARKIGMDEAVDRFNQINGEEGVIVCFDADSKCDSNYLSEIYNSFSQNRKAPGASIYYEHPLEGDEFQSHIYDGIIQYELFLRYYRQAFKFTGHPQAFHTVGSSMAVKTWAYQKQSGMNKRKAGEDFYFLQKIIQLGDFMEINSTRVIPSPRTSDRVPFGTGRSMLEYLDGDKMETTYSFHSFQDVKIFIELFLKEYETNKLYDNTFLKSLPLSIQSFLEQNDFEVRIKDMLEYGTNTSSFSKRFYNWFNAFRVLKFIHFSRDAFYENESILFGCKSVLSKLNISVDSDTESLAMLGKFRLLDKNPA